MTGFIKLRFIISTFPHTTCCRISLLQNPNFRSLPRPKFATTPHTSRQVGTRLRVLDIVPNHSPMTHDQLISRYPQPIGRQQLEVSSFTHPSTLHLQHQHNPVSLSKVTFSVAEGRSVVLTAVVDNDVCRPCKPKYQRCPIGARFPCESRVLPLAQARV